MDFKRKHLPIVILIMSNAWQSFSDKNDEGDFKDEILPHLEDDSQLTSCDFESLCYWTFAHNNTHSDWSVVSAQQLKGTKAATAPVVDHSAGRSDGHFLLLNQTDGRSCEHQIISPVLPGSDGRCVLQVALYESGPTVGNLTVLIKPLLSDSVVRSELLNRRTPDAPRAEWEVSKAVIGQMDEPFQVTLLYTCSVDGGGVTVALDSLDFIDCISGDEAAELNVACGESFHCVNSDVCVDRSRVCNFHTDCPLGEDEGLICDALPFGSYCSFESDSCGWSGSGSGSGRRSGWRRVAGDELLDKQDMQGVTLQRTAGHFMYLQVRERHSFQEASIQSSLFPPPVSTPACQMRFSLYLYGTFNGSLEVAIVENGSAEAPFVWERRGQSTDDWEAVALELTGLHDGIQIQVKATWGLGSSADLAFDDVAVGAACFSADLNSLLQMEDFDILSPLPEPSVTEVSLMTWWFNSCGASGPHGPTQAQCDNTYRNKNVSVTVGKDGPLKGVQMWKVPATNRYLISAYGAAGGKGAKNHNKHNHGVFISAIFPLEKGEILHILVGHQGEDACPGRNQRTQKICLGESSEIEDSRGSESGAQRAGGGGGGGGATYIFKMEGGELVPLLIAAGGGGNAYLEDPESSLELMPLERFENSTAAQSTSGQTGAAGGGGGWRDTPTPHPSAGRCLVEGAVGGASCHLAQSKLSWSTYGGFGGGGGACTAGGGGGGYKGGDAALTDDMTADGQSGVSFIHPMGEIFLQPLAVMEAHGECEVKVQLNCSHCRTQSCKRDEDTRLVFCLCDDDEFLASDNVTCISAAATPGPVPQGQLSTSLILAVVVSVAVSGVALVCAGVLLSKRLLQFCAQSVPATFHRL